DLDRRFIVSWERREFLTSGKLPGCDSPVLAHCGQALARAVICQRVCPSTPTLKCASNPTVLIAQRDRAVGASGGEQVARAERCSCGAGDRDGLRARVQAPHRHASTTGLDGKQFSGTVEYQVNDSAVSRQRSQLLAGEWIPNLHRLIAPRRSEASLVRAE